MARIITDRDRGFFSPLERIISNKGITNMNKNILNLLNGFIFTSVLTLVSMYIASLQVFYSLSISPLLIGVLAGILFSSVYRAKEQFCNKGVSFSAKKLLRLGIVLYGFRITLEGLASVGVSGVAISLSVVVGILCIGTFLGIRIFRLDKEMALLISVGSAICGAAAILALESALKSPPYKGLIAIGCVVVFGLLGMFFYPLLYSFSALGLDSMQWGIFLGVSLHEVANVVAAGSAISNECQDFAVIVKMLRVLLLIPVLLVVPLFFRDAQGTKALQIPYFAFGFLGVIVLHSTCNLPQLIVESANMLCTFCLVMAMSALGLQIDFKKFAAYGLKAFSFGFVLCLILGVGSYALVRLFTY